VLDWWLALKVRLRLAGEFIGLADCFSIGVRCREGHIMLFGSIKNEYRQCKAEEAARRVQGVVSVTNRIAVREPLRLERRTHVLVGPWSIPTYPEITIEEPPEDDRATSAAAFEALGEEHVPTGEGGVRVCAVGRTVYLLGSVHDKATAEVAKRVALALPQVEEVRNKLHGTSESPEAGVPGRGSASSRAGEKRE